MTRIRRIFNLLDLPAILPSIVVAVIHFKLSILVGVHANEVFQRWFDTGERASGADAVIASVDKFLAKPIPTVLVAAHPAYGLSVEWWLATAVNSILWGTAIYACYRLSSWLFKRLNVL